MCEIQVESWQKFVKVADHLDVGSVESGAYTYRGQSDTNWTLRPSLLRYLFPVGCSAERALKIESIALKEFLAQAHNHISDSTYRTTTDTLSWFTLMQYHGAPTRLLDWTASIYVAAYFAAIENWEKDGAVWLLHTHEMRKQLAKRHQPVTIPKSENQIKTAFLTPDAPHDLELMGRLNKSDRMIAQQGLFSISRSVLGDHGQILADLFDSEQEKIYFRKLVVPAKLKPEFIRKLRAMNITASSLFPGLDGLSRSIAELVKVASQEVV